MTFCRTKKRCLDESKSSLSLTLASNEDLLLRLASNAVEAERIKDRERTLLNEKARLTAGKEHA
jgi:hypothetical protein